MKTRLLFASRLSMARRGAAVPGATFTPFRRIFAAGGFLLASTLAVTAIPGAGQAKGPTAEELAAGEACLRQICAVLEASPDKPEAITCDLSRTWSEEEISASIEKKLKVKWSLGSAQCGVKINVPSAKLSAVYGPGEHQLTLAKQPVSCTLKRGEKSYPVKFTLAPVLKMKDKKAVGASLGMTDIEAPAAIKAVLWSASKLDSAFSAFENSTIREVNKFLDRGCQKLKK